MTKSVRSLARLRLVVHWLIPTKGTDPAASSPLSLPCLPGLPLPGLPLPGQQPSQPALPLPLGGLARATAHLHDARQQGLGDAEAAFLRPGLLPVYQTIPKMRNFQFCWLPRPIWPWPGPHSRHFMRCH